MAILEAFHLTKEFQMGKVLVHALRGVNVSVEQGEFIAVMGPSGSGKSTLLHLLGGLDRPTSGEVILSGQSLYKLNDDQITLLRRRKIGFIFQFFNLLPTLTTAENVGLPLLIDGQRLRRHHQYIDQLLQLVELQDRADHRPDQLSGGQQQRLAIARAFVTRPEIVLADEPTGNLDTRSGVRVLELLQRSCQELGATIVMVTHDSHAASYAGRVLFLQDGLVVQELCQSSGGLTMQDIMNEITRLESDILEVDVKNDYEISLMTE